MSIRGSTFKEVRHRPWRDFDELRTRSTDAVMGLAFGLQLATSEVESRIDASDDRPLGEIYPTVDAAADFSFRPPRAVEELDSAEGALAQMTVPFAVSIYNEYLIEVVGLYERYKPSGLPRPAATMMFGDLVQYLDAAHGVSVGGRQGELLDLLSHVRNRIVHYGARAGDHLVGLVAGLSADASAAWIRVAGHPFPTPVAHETIRLGRRDAAAALASVDHAASELNQRMQTDFPQDFWADLLVEDCREQNPQAWHFDDLARRKKKLRGYAQRNYAALGMVAEDIEEAVERAPVELAGSP